MSYTELISSKVVKAPFNGFDIGAEAERHGLLGYGSNLTASRFTFERSSVFQSSRTNDFFTMQPVVNESSTTSRVERFMSPRPTPRRRSRLGKR